MSLVLGGGGEDGRLQQDALVSPSLPPYLEPDPDPLPASQFLGQPLTVSHYWYPHSVCGTYFCYKCRSDITSEGYGHFGTACVLFNQDEVDRWNRRMNLPQRNIQQEMMRIVFRGEEGAQAMRAKSVRCGNCQALNVLFNRNNQ